MKTSLLKYDDDKNSNYSIGSPRTRTAASIQRMSKGLRKMFERSASSNVSATSGDTSSPSRLKRSPPPSKKFWRLKGEKSVSYIKKKKSNNTSVDQLMDFSFRMVDPNALPKHTIPLPEGTNRDLAHEEPVYDEDYESEGEPEEGEDYEKAPLVSDLPVPLFQSRNEEKGMPKAFFESDKFDIKTPIKQDMPASFRQHPTKQDI